MESRRYLSLALHCTLCLFAWSLSFCFFQNRCEGQTEVSDGTDPSKKELESDELFSLLPYRRVFVAGDEVESIGINNRDYTMLDKKRLEEFLGPFRADRSSSEHQSQPVELQASTYIARLVGPTLVSNASRIEFSRGSVVAERIRLQPWSLALSNNGIDQGIPWGDANGATGAIRRSRWGFDEKGNPLIDLHRDDPSIASDPLAVGFSWILNSQPDSSPTQLRFQADIPRVLDSCMLITLPPQSQIIDANVAVIEVKDWGTIEKRLPGWSEGAKSVVDRQRIAGSSDSLWLLELGGVERLRFTISIKQSGLESSSSWTNQENMGTLDHLVLQQRVEYAIDASFVQTRCAMEIAWDRQAPNRTIRFQLPKDSRLAKLSLADVDLDWRFEDGWVVCSEQILNALNPKEAKITLNAELLTDFSGSLPKDVSLASLAKWRLPTLQLDRSYVLSGVSSLVVQPGLRLAYLTTSHGRYLPDSSSISTPAMLQLEWWDQIPSVVIEVSNEPVRELLQVATKFSDSDGQTRAVVRITSSRPFRTDQLFEVEEGWSVKEVVPSESKRPLVVESVTLEGTRHSSFRIGRDSIGQAGRSIDVTIVPSKENEVRSILYPQGGWVRVRSLEKSVSAVFLVENLATVEELPSLAFTRSLAIDSLPSFQSSLVASPERALAWIVDSKDEFELKRNAPESMIGLDVDATLQRVGDRLLRYQLRLSLNSVPNKPLVVRMTPTAENRVRWAIQDEGGGKIQFDPLSFRDSSTSSWIARLSPSMISKGSRSVFLEQDLYLDTENSVSIPLPVFENTQIQSWKMAIDDGLYLAQADSDRWLLGPAGAFVVDIQSNREPLRIGLDADKVPIPLDELKIAASTLAASASIDLLVDSNNDAFAKCRVRILGPLTLDPGLELKLMDDWTIDPSSINTVGDGNQLSVYATPTNGLSIRRPSLQSGRTEQQLQGGPFESIPKVEFDFCCRRTLGTKDRSSSSPLSEHRVLLPKLMLSDKQLSTSGRVWMPSSIQRSLASSAGETGGKSVSWYGFPWWKQGVATLFGVESKTPRLPVETVLPKDLHDSVFSPSKEWVLADSWGMESTRESIVLRATVWNRNLQLSLLLLSTLVGAWSVRRIWICVLVFVGAAVLLFPLGVPELIPAIPFVMSGLVFGACMNALYRLVPIAATQDPVANSAGTGQSWEGTGPLVGRAKDVKQIVVSVFIGWMISCSAFAQSPRSDGNLIAPYDLVFPLDTETGIWKQDQVYVPTSLFNATRGISGASHTLLSAKHQLRLGTRTRPLTAVDQLVLSYDFWIGAPGTPIEFPLGASLSSLGRFTVDESEVAFGRTLRRIDGGVAWIPDKPGKQSVQLLLTPTFVNGTTTDSNVSGVIQQSLELPIMPAGNATLEVEADPLLQVEVDSLGGTTNPAPGRYLVSLGNVSKLLCRLKYSPGGGATTTPNNPNPVTMSTEYLMQQSILRAKTVIKVPKGSSLERRFEMEADSPWQPLNTSWDNAKLIEVRGASTLSRRRYVFEWSSPIDTTDDASVAILWVLRDNSVTALNALFAECLDRRVRHSTLRFARLSGADWNIEQVNTWIPAINERERLDWPELASTNKGDSSNTSINPRVTSLRVPLNGGFGILRRTPKVERLQARVASRWAVASRMLSLSTRIELLGTPAGDILELMLPAGYTVTEARHRLGDFRVLQQSMVHANGLTFERVQLLAERLLWENADISIRAEKPIEGSSNTFETPWMSFPFLPTVDQTLELSATDQWAVLITDSTNGERSLLGRGITNAIATLNRTDLVHFQRRSQPVSMRFDVELHPRTDNERFDLDIQIASQRSESGLPVVIVQLPASYADYWRCERPSSMIPCPMRDTVWIQVELSPGTEESNWTLSLDLSQQDLVELVSHPRQIRIVHDSSIQILGAPLSELFASIPLTQRATTATSGRESAHPWIAWHSLQSSTPRLADTGSATGEKPVNKTIESRYWLSQTDAHRVNSNLEWVIPQGLSIEQVSLCGKPVSWVAKEDRLRVPSLVCIDGCTVEIAIRSRFSSETESPIGIPTLFPEDSLPVCKHMVDWPITEAMKTLETVPSVLEDQVSQCLAIIKHGIEVIPPMADKGSPAIQWISFWAYSLQSLTNELDSRENSTETRDEVASLIDASRLVLKDVGQRLGDDSLRLKDPVQFAQATISRQVKQPQPSDVVTTWTYVLSLLSLLGVLTISRLPNKRPWWNLLALGGIAWWITGWLIVAIVFALIAWIVATDTFLINRAYHAATRLKRSLP